MALDLALDLDLAMSLAMTMALAMANIIVTNKIGKKIQDLGISEKILISETRIQGKSLKRLIRFDQCLPSLKTAVILSRYFNCKIEDLIMIEGVSEWKA